MTSHMLPPIVRSVADLRAQVASWRAEGLKVGFVPTMGALHPGHLSLVQAAKTKVDRVVVSVFVNPTQFGPNEDLDAYPRQEAADRESLATVNAHLMYAPTVAEMYPDGFATKIDVSGVSEGLCGGDRPGHFSGVATVVTKLLLQVGPDVAAFGEKDYQQLQVIRRLVKDLDIPVEIMGVPISREEDGLARSSRNAYLSASDRAVAPALYRMLQRVAASLQAGVSVADALASGQADILAEGFHSVDYLELRSADNLAVLDKFDRPACVLVAARLGKTRLIDNLELAP